MRFPQRDRPIVLTVAGSDCSGGAGIQADIRAIEANGGYAAAIVTAITAQNRRSILDVAAVSEELVQAQLDAVLADREVAAVKSGMLASGAIVRELARALRRHPVQHYVCDPLLVSSGGTPLLEQPAIPLLRGELFPLAALVTPNVPEAEALTGLPIAGAADAERAARRLMSDGAAAVLVKGGHRSDRPGCDLLVTPQGATEIPGAWIDTADTHGTGCLLSAAIATALAQERDLLGAVTEAKAFVNAALRHGLSPEGGRPAARVGGLHVILDETRQTTHGHVELARLAAAGGADLIQYREKRRLPTAERVATANAVRESLCEFPARMIVNDRADVALASGACGVHLGHDDLDPDTARRMLGEPALIGATANDLETARRLSEQPVDYLGVGPVFGTASKDDPAPTLGLEGLARIVAAVPQPVVAIGNITPERVASVLAAGATGIAVLSGVVCHADPREAARRFRREIDRWMSGKERSVRAR